MSKEKFVGETIFVRNDKQIQGPQGEEAGSVRHPLESRETCCPLAAWSQEGRCKEAIPCEFQLTVTK